jgi:hypothetical protein
MVTRSSRTRGAQVIRLGEGRTDCLIGDESWTAAASYEHEAGSESIGITAFERSPHAGRGLARDMRVRWAFEPKPSRSAA